MTPDRTESPRGQLASIERTLGQIQGGMAAILREMERNRIEERESRQRLHDRLEKVETEISTVGEIAAQAKNKAAALEKVITDDVKPQTDKIKILTIRGGGVVAVLSLIGGMSGSQAWGAVASFFTNIAK